MSSGATRRDRTGDLLITKNIAGSKLSISSIRKCLISTTWGSCFRSNSNSRRLKQMGFWHSFGTGKAIAPMSQANRPLHHSGL